MNIEKANKVFAEADLLVSEAEVAAAVKRMAQEITKPTTIGILRESDSDRFLRSSMSDRMPPNTPPTKPAIAGAAAAKPAWVMDRPRALTR